MITIKGKIEGCVIGDGKTVNNTFSGGNLVHQTVNGRTQEEREARRNRILSAGLHVRIADWYADLDPKYEESVRKIIKEQGVNIDWEE